MSLAYRQPERRIACIVPFCSRSRAASSRDPEGTEWCCDPHYRAIPIRFRRAYHRADERLTTAETRVGNDPSAQQNINDYIAAQLAYNRLWAWMRKRAMRGIGT